MERRQFQNVKVAIPPSQPDVRKAVDRVSETEDWSVYLCNTVGNTLFYLPDITINYNMLSEMDLDPAAAIQKLFGDSLHISRTFILFLDHLMLAIIQKHWPDFGALHKNDVN